MSLRARSSEKRRPLGTIITGAAHGIGKAYARRFAEVQNALQALRTGAADSKFGITIEGGTGGDTIRVLGLGVGWGAELYIYGNKGGSEEIIGRAELSIGASIDAGNDVAGHQVLTNSDRADPRIANREGQTALRVAMLLGHDDIYRALAALVRDLMAERIAHHTGQTVEQVQEDSERDRFFDAEEAVEYGLIDRVIEQRELTRRETGFRAG